MSGFVMGLCFMVRNVKPQPSVDAAGKETHVRVSETACRFVLQKLADACNNEGRGSRPVAKRFISDDTDLSEKVVQRVLGHLQEIGIITAWGGEAGGRGISRTYDIDIDRLAQFIPPESLPKSMRGSRPGPEEPAAPKGDTMTPFADPKGGHENPERGTSGTQKGVTMTPHYVDYKKSTTGAGKRASEPEGSRAARPGGRRSKRRTPAPEPQAGPPPDPPVIQIPAGLEGEIVAAALAGNDPGMAWKVEPWLGRFRVVVAMGGARKLVIDGDEGGFRSVFTGAMKHLGLYGPDDRPEPIWRADFLHRAMTKGRAEWSTGGPPEAWFSNNLRRVEPIDQGEERRYGTA